MTIKKISDNEVEVTLEHKQVRTKEDLEYEKGQVQEEMDRIDEMLSHFK